MSLSPRQLSLIRSPHGVLVAEGGVIESPKADLDAPIKNLRTGKKRNLNLPPKPKKRILVTDRFAQSSSTAFSVFPSRLTKAQWDALTKETFNYQTKQMGAAASDLVTLGCCWLEDSVLRYQQRKPRGRGKTGANALSMVFVHRGDRRQPEELMHLLAERQLGFSPLAATPSGTVTVEERRMELRAMFEEQRRLSENPSGPKGRVTGLAETLHDSCCEVIELMSADSPSLADLLEVAAAAYEAGKAHAWLDTLKDEQLLNNNKKAATFGNSKTGTFWLKQDISRFKDEHEGEAPTPRQLLEFAGYTVRGPKHHLEMFLPGEETALPFRAFEKRVQRLVKRPRGRPRKSP